MNKELIQERLRQLTEQRDQTRSVLLVCEGAIQDCQHWLNLETPSEEEKKED